MDIPSVEKAEKLWSFQFFILALGALFLQIASYMTNTTAGSYILALGGSKSVSGLGLAVFSTCALLTRTFAGKMLDTRGRKLVLTLGAFVVFAATVCYNFAFSVVMLLIVRGIHGIGYSLNNTASNTAISDTLPRSRLTEGIGIFGVTGTLSSAIGPAISTGMLEGDGGYKGLFICVAVCGTILLSVCLIFHGGKASEPLTEQLKETKTDGKQHNFLNTMFDKNVLPMALIMLISSVSQSSVLSFLFIHASTREISPVSAYFAVNSVSTISTRFMAGKIIKKLGETKVYVLGMLLNAVSFILIAFAFDIRFLVVAALLYGMGSAVAQPIVFSAVIKVAQQKRKGAANATYYSAQDIGMATGSTVMGVISAIFGMTVVYLTAAASSVLSIVMFLVMIPKRIAAADAKYAMASKVTELLV